MTFQYSESHVEEAALAYLADLGYQIAAGPEVAPDTKAAERLSYTDVILLSRLTTAIERLNPDIPSTARDDAIRQLLRSDYQDATEENRRLHRRIVDGVDVEFTGLDGTIKSETVRLVDFTDPDANDWLAINQFTVIGEGERRPDVVVFINGLPIAVIELKNPFAENATLDGAYNQLQTYKKQIPALFRTNGLLVTSDGIGARVGSLTADKERFMRWRTIDGSVEEDKSLPELEVLIRGLFDKARLLQLLKDFVVFASTGNDLIKIVAGYHQYHAALKGVDETIRATSAGGDKKIGVIWHTQGSGKSLLMAFYAGIIIKHPAMRNPTLVVITDRRDLDEQLFQTFSMCADLLRQKPEQAEDRADLRRRLDRASGGVIFTTIQKFTPDDDEDEFPLLTDRRNVVVIADEAHRSQYGFQAKIDANTGAMSYGFAKHLRDALPNASFIGFTGTPVEAGDINTPAVFGTYIDQYDISQAVRDEATVPIYYESRLARIELDDAERPVIDAEVADQTDGLAETEERKLSAKLSGVEAVVGSQKRLALIAADLVEHYEKRAASLHGKAMIVCMSRRIAVDLYEAIRKIRPDWHDDDDAAGAMKIVMTGSASDPIDWQQHIGANQRRRSELLAKRAKNADDPLKLVIVRDMWLTGFDAPSMHTMYVDKPMRGHGLMQAIARVNRVFKDKPAGLIVDYIGIAQNLKEALAVYSTSDRDKTGVDLAQAAAVLQEKCEIVRAMFRPSDHSGFDYTPALAMDASPQLRLKIMAGALEWILSMQQRDAAAETDLKRKKDAHRRFADAVLNLTKANTIAVTTDKAAELAPEVGFFQAIRTALVKSSSSDGPSLADREAAIRQIVSRAVVSTDIVNILEAAGIQIPDITVLQEQCPSEALTMSHKNLAIEALRKLLNGEIRAQGERNVTMAKAFSERLEGAIQKYHNNAITTAEALEELIKIAKDYQAAQARGEAHGLSNEEMAFYDALAANESAVEAMKEDTLRFIATALVKTVRENSSVDWIHRESARAQMRKVVKRLLREFGYPPDLASDAVKNVLAQAERFAKRSS